MSCWILLGWLISSCDPCVCLTCFAYDLVQVKWKSGWRNILEARDAAFVAYWARLLPSLPQELSPPVSPGLLEAYGCSSPFVCAPMVLQSERSFRIMVKRHGVGVAFSPMIVSSEIVNGGLEACTYHIPRS